MLFYIIPHKRSYPASCRRKCRSRPSVHYNDLDLILPAHATSSMLDDMMSPLSLSTTNNDKQTYRVSEDDSKYEIVLDVPGVKPADIKVQLEQGAKVLHVSGERKVRGGSSKCGEYKFEKRWRLHNAIEMSDVSANVTDGVLEITLPKVKVEEKEDVVMNIEVTSASGEDDNVEGVNHEEEHLDDNDDEKGVK